MDKDQAIHSFWSGFTWPAIDEQSSYDESTLQELGVTDRYISYEVLTGSLGSPLQLNASLWHRSTSWEHITQKKKEIAAFIGYGGKVLPVDGGYLWIKLTNPFGQRFSAETGDDWRRILLTIEVDFLTAT